MFERPGIRNNMGAGQQEQSFLSMSKSAGNCTRYNKVRGIIMAIIMRKSGQKRDGGDKKKALYTWSGCGLVIILTLVTVLPNMASEPKPDYSSFSSSKMQDLADLPFGSDSEEDEFLRNNPEYKQLSNIDLLNSLFSPEERQERQIRDEEDGIPLPPDPEYEEIFSQKRKVEKAKEIVKERGEKKTRAREQFVKEKQIQQEREKQKAIVREEQKRIKREQEKAKIQQTNPLPPIAKYTPPAKNSNPRQQVRSSQEPPKSKPITFSGSNMVGGTGGGTSVTSSIWRYEGKNINTGTANNTPLTGKDIDYAMKHGRNVGLDTALLSSAKGAKAGDAEGAATGAIDAFQKEATAVDLDKAKQEVGIDEEGDIPDGVDMGIQDELKRAINDEAEKNDNNNDDDKKNNNGNGTNENCMKRDGSPDWQCWLMKAANTALEQGLGALTNCITGGCGGDGWQILSDKNGPIMQDGKYVMYKGNQMKLVELKP